MKYLKIVSILAFIALLGCKETSKTKVIDAEIESKQEYVDNQFRRYTYILESDSEAVAETFKSSEWATAKNEASTISGYELNAYKKDNQYFFVFDVKPSLNSKDMLNDFMQKPAFKLFREKLKDAGANFPKHNEALERIYKLDQKVVYTPTEGQLKVNIGEYKRFVWTLLLQEDPEMIAEYKRIHSIGQAWPQITKNMKSIGVKDMEIYLYGEQAILIMDTNPDFDLGLIGPKWQALPKESEWQAYVAKYQRTKPGSSIQEKWLDMNKQ